MNNNMKSIEFDLFRPFYIQVDQDGITKEYAYFFCVFELKRPFDLN